MAEEPEVDLCLEGTIPFDATRAWAGQCAAHATEFLGILSQTAVAVATLMHMQSPSQVRK